LWDIICSTVYCTTGIGGLDCCNNSVKYEFYILHRENSACCGVRQSESLWFIVEEVYDPDSILSISFYKGDVAIFKEGMV